jgi:MtfA peptidase
VVANAAWVVALERQPYLGALTVAARHRLRDLATSLLAQKAVNAAGGLVLDDAIVAGIALQAALPVLELGLDAYPPFEEIIVYPSDFVVDRTTEDDDGVVHEWTEAIAGETWDGGPLIVAWDAASGERGGRSGRRTSNAFNVVIHEFAHKLDMANGSVDGVPRFSRALHPTLAVDAWTDTLVAALDDFAARVDAAEAAIPRHIDPESLRADRYYETLPLDAYAATDEGEFFSVTSEAFFVTPERLADAYPAWYALLAAYYRQDLRTPQKI